jgi:hypothetical protein
MLGPPGFYSFTSALLLHIKKSALIANQAPRVPNDSEASAPNLLFH